MWNNAVVWLPHVHPRLESRTEYTSTEQALSAFSLPAHQEHTSWEISRTSQSIDVRFGVPWPASDGLSYLPASFPLDEVFPPLQFVNQDGETEAADGGGLETPCSPCALCLPQRSILLSYHLPDT